MDATISRPVPYALQVHVALESFRQRNVLTRNDHRLVAARRQDGHGPRGHPHVRPRSQM